MEPAERERFLAALRADDGFRAAVRRELLTDELLTLPQTVAELSSTVGDLVSTVGALVDAVAERRQDINAVCAKTSAGRRLSSA